MSDNVGAVPKRIASVLVIFKNNLFSWSHRLIDACYSFSFSSMTNAWFAEQNNTVSSAYIRTVHCTAASGRSFTCRINKRGPRIDPCGTPTATPSGSDDTPRNSTTCVRSWSYSLNRLSSLSTTPRFYNLSNSSPCRTVSNAFRKSINTAPVRQLWSIFLLIASAKDRATNSVELSFELSNDVF